MFRIKICGITSVNDAKIAAEAGADAIGLNFFRNSKRYVTPELAMRIADEVKGRMAIVGVFVNETTERIVEIAGQLPVDVIQLHGDEPVPDVTGIRRWKVCKAFRLGENEEPIHDFIVRCQRAGKALDAVLLDANVPGQFGGTGVTVSWENVRRFHETRVVPCVVLAGGLTPLNVATAIAISRPQAVDTASGVEKSPGIKDPRLVHSFVEEARSALENI